MNQKVAITQTKDEINQPIHYTSHPSGIESVEVFEHFWFNLANAGKYIWRASLKNPDHPEVDIKKSIWYLRREARRAGILDNNKYPYLDNNGSHPALSRENIVDVVNGFDYPYNNAIDTIIACGTKTLYKHPDDKIICNVLNILANILERHVPEIDKFKNQVNHPKHYNSHPSGFEAIELVEGFRCNIGNALKYVWRAGLKEHANKAKDYKKAIWYINREIYRIKVFDISYPFVFSSHSTLSDQDLKKIIHGFEVPESYIIELLISAGLGRVSNPENYLLLALAELGLLIEQEEKQTK